ncbi:hypothetical protein [Pseudoalteromonas sp.]|uniref:hypothetical protein n=1 Tax=Pseudoalteromonas sp. TaxID=53249 RepID=UPI003568C8D0
MTSNKKRLLVFVSDLGAAQIITSLYHLLSAKFEICLLLSKTGCAKPIKNFIYVETKEEVLAHLTQFSPDLILLGTSNSNLIEPIIISTAKTLKIKTISFVDQWHNYLQRFQSQARLILPDKVLLPDQNALIEFSQLVSKKVELIACGQPYLAQFRKLSRQTKRSKNLKVLLISEPISTSLNKEQKNALYGFDEKHLLKSTIKVLNLLKVNYKLTVKLHPKEIKFKNKHEKRAQFINKAITFQQLASYDIIIGMHSTMLITAYLIGLKVIIFHPNGINHFDHCMLSRFNYLKRITTNFALLKALKRRKRGQHRLALQDFKPIDFVNHIK